MRMAALLFSVVAFFSPAASAQARNSAPLQPQARPATQPAQNQSAGQAQAFMEALRKSILQARPSTGGPKVKNPSAASARNAMLTVLGRQKQTAAEEKAQILQMKPSKLRITTSQDVKVMPHARLPAGTTTTTPAKGGPAPQNIALDLSLCSPAGITTVNRQSKDVVFTPDPQYNLYTISGCKFGDQQGEVHLYGHFKSQIIKMNVEYWSSSMIVAAVDPGVTGEADQDSGVTLVVKPAGAPQMQQGGFRFYAAREVVQLPSLPQSDFRQTSGCTADNVGFSSPADGGTAHVVRTGTQGLPTGFCATSAEDSYIFRDLAPGFTPDSFQYSYNEITQAQCNAQGIGQGTLSSVGKWDGQWDGDVIRMHFRVVECVPSFIGHTSRIDASNYWLNVWVIGPKGVSARR